ncbi:MAG: hypothetical protein AAF495_08935 [Pseudomonadota bacterium]
MPSRPTALHPCALATALLLALPATALADVSDNEVATRHIQDGAVTFAKLAPDAVFTNTVVVSPVGPTPQDNCLELLAVHNSIDDAGPDNPYLVYVEPGVYHCGAERIIMKPFVNIQGSGPNMTFIKGHVGNRRGFITLSSDSELHGVNVDNRSPIGEQLDRVVAIGSTGVDPLVNWRISNVTANAARGEIWSFGIEINTSDCDGEIDNVRVGASKRINQSLAISLDISCTRGSLRINALTAESENGIEIRYSGPFSTVEIVNSKIAGRTTDASPKAVINFGHLFFVNTQIIGDVDEPTRLDIMKCLGGYDENFNPLSRNCQQTDFFTPVIQTK